MKRIIRMIGFVIGSLIGLIIIVSVLFLNFNPQFGKSPSREQKNEYQKYSNFKKGHFVNESPSPMDIEYGKVLREFMKKAPERSPAKNILTRKIDPASIANLGSETTRLTWFGHSTFLLELDGKKILIDPMFGNSPSPLPWLGTKRYSEELPIKIDQLPFIDAVIISHDHYDHLDYGSIQKLKDKVGQYFVPIAVGNHLAKWGISKDKIRELYWWEETEFKGVELVCCPARHFSGRGLFDRTTTLWSSWVIKGKKDNIYFSGDSGYDKHFEKIGDKYGPFDISLLECGQYNTDWKYIHMMPEETAKAGKDLRSEWIMPIHWGAFTLALHSWTDPVERVLSKAKELDIRVATPEIGEPMIIGSETYPTNDWWMKYLQPD